MPSFLPLKMHLFLCGMLIAAALDRRGPVYLGGAVLLAAIPIAVVALLQRRFHRYALRGTSLQVMRGVIAQRDWIVPYQNVQVVTLRAGWFQRRLGLASVLVDTAGASGYVAPDVVDLATPDARELAAGLVAREGIQMFGAMGFTDDSDIGLFLKRIMVLTRVYRTTQAHRTRVADSLFEEGAPDLFDLFRSESEEDAAFRREVRAFFVGAGHAED